MTILLAWVVYTCQMSGCFPEFSRLGAEYYDALPNRTLSYDPEWPYTDIASLTLGRSPPLTFLCMFKDGEAY